MLNTSHQAKLSRGSFSISCSLNFNFYSAQKIVPRASLLVKMGGIHAENHEESEHGAQHVRKYWTWRRTATMFKMFLLAPTSSPERSLVVKMGGSDAEHHVELSVRAPNSAKCKTPRSRDDKSKLTPCLLNPNKLALRASFVGRACADDHGGSEHGAQIYYTSSK